MGKLNNGFDIFCGLCSSHGRGGGKPFERELIRVNKNKVKIAGNAIIMKHNPRGAKRRDEEQIRQNNATYGTTDAQPKNCNRGAALERSVGGVGVGEL